MNAPAHGTVTGYNRGCRCPKCKDRMSAYTKAYRQKNLVRVRGWEREKRIRNAEKIAARKKEERARNLEAHKVRAAAYYQRNKERTIERARVWSQANRERINEHKRRKRLENPEWAEAQRVYQRLYQSYRRGLKRGAPGRFTKEQIQARIAYYGGKCYLCGAPYEHLDHVLPLSRGGSNWPSNIRPACATCNTRKHNKTLAEFLAA